MKIKSLLTRSVSGLIYCLIIVGCILWGMTGAIVLALLLGGLACVELTKINHELSWRQAPALALDMCGIFCLAFAGTESAGVFALLLWLFVLICRLVEQLYLRSPQPLKDMAVSALTQVYIGVPMMLMVLLAELMHPHVLLALFFLIWINDTGAFLVGSAVGRHRLFERISPKKSWEGFFGGLIFTVAASAAFGHWCNHFFLGTAWMSLWGWMGLGLIVTVFATWGDLVESMIKRDLKIKDSGNIIPGHGGILDRIDSLLLVLPAATLYFFFTACFTGFLG